jgi:peptidoglycan/LPS O-acetylase OafA/YrhL
MSESAVQGKVRYEYVDVLRGYAILLVIFVHASQMIVGLQKYVSGIAIVLARTSRTILVNPCI